MSVALPRTIGFGTALAEQFRWFWQRQHEWIITMTLLLAGGCSWIITSLPNEEPVVAFFITGNTIHLLLLLVALSWSLSVWRDDPPKDRQYFWLHPVNRTGHTIARSLAGFLWLSIVIAIVIGIVLGISILQRGEATVLGSRLFWYYVVAAIVMTYIAASVAPMLSDRPGQWIAVLFAGVILADIIAKARDVDWLKAVVSVFYGAPRSFGTALSAPGVEAARVLMLLLPPGETYEGPSMHVIPGAEPAEALMIWLVISTVAYLVAARLSLPR